MSAGVIALTLGGVGCPADDTPVDAGPDPVDRGVDATDGPGDAARDVTPPPDDAMLEPMGDVGPDGTTMSDLGVDARPTDGGGDAAPDGLPPDMDPPMIDMGPRCVGDEECAGGICDDGRCRPCMGDGECASGLCDEGACRPCAEDDECATGLCAAEACVPCRDDAECSSGLCEDEACVPCLDDAQCPGICEDGACAPCVDDARCPGICRDGVCAPCEDDAQCPGLCRERACVPCADNTECGEDVCVGGVCQPCEADEECGEGQACFADSRCGPATIIDAMRAEPDLGNMLEAIRLAGSTDDLRGRDTVTLFAPTDPVLQSLPGLCLAVITDDWGSFVRHHTLFDPVAPAPPQIVQAIDQAGGALRLPMDSFEEVVLTRRGDEIDVDGSPIVRALEAGNGRVYVIEGWVLLTDALARPENECAPPEARNP